MPAQLFEKPASVQDVIDQVSKMKSVITDAVEDGFRTAMNATKQGRRTAEDAVDDARHAVKKNPLEAVAIAFGAGMVTGAIAMWIARRR